MSVNLNVRDNNGISVIDISGRLTLGDVPTILKDEIRRLLDEGRKRNLLNLAGVTYMDSSGMGLLVGGYATVSREGGQLKLSNLNSRIGIVSHAVEEQRIDGGQLLADDSGEGGALGAMTLARGAEAAEEMNLHSRGSSQPDRRPV